MCGIAGLVLNSGERVERAVLGRMIGSLAHRGPDAEGLLVEGNVGLGHRRLSIIDTSEEANQPFEDTEGQIAMSFNGEVYNFKELAEELGAKGYRFRTRSDTEVVIAAWKEFGPRMVDRFRGMFALALFDRAKRQLFLARDHFGKKPLYYCHDSSGFVFGSEIKALLARPGVSRDLDLGAIGQYMTFGCTVGERTVYRQVRALLPGHSLLLSTDQPNLDPVVERFWDYQPDPVAANGHPPDTAALLEELDASLREAVRLRMISDVPLGVFLSGGIDSSLIVAYMSQLSDEPVQSYSIGFREEGWDESGYARAVADHLGTDHLNEMVTPDALEVLPSLVEAYDQPFADASAIPTWYVSRLARRHVKVALSGDGGDELFYGYQRYPSAATLDRLGRAITPLGRLAARGLSHLMPQGSYLRRGLDRVSQRGVVQYLHALGFSGVFLRLLRPEVLQALGPVEEQEAARDFVRAPDLSLLQRCQYTDIRRFLADQILVKVDRASMAHSLEVRSPILDQGVAAVAARISPAAQLGKGEQKLLLRQLAYRYVPRTLLDRPKQGFSVPLVRWFRNELEPEIRRAIDDEKSPMWAFFDRKEAKSRLEGHLAGRANAEHVLWRLLFFSAWTERHLR